MENQPSQILKYRFYFSDSFGLLFKEKMWHTTDFGAFGATAPERQN